MAGTPTVAATLSRQSIANPSKPMKKQIKFFNIQWDTDGADADLPESVILEVSDEIDLADEGADLLTNEYGFCVAGFNFERIQP
jgi:hypothetical protein